MIRGAVNAHDEAVVRLRVRGPGGVEASVDAVIDSGFSGSLTLPAAIVSQLGLVRRSSGRGTLADGSIQIYEVYAAELEWDASWRLVHVSAIGGETLVGMRLLAGHELRVEVEPNGDVEITPLP
jgi:clan AA aspartic protease